MRFESFAWYKKIGAGYFVFDFRFTAAAFGFLQGFVVVTRAF